MSRVQREQEWASNRAPVPGALKVVAPAQSGDTAPIPRRPDAKPKQQPHRVSLGPSPSLTPTSTSQGFNDEALEAAACAKTGSRDQGQLSAEHLQIGASPVISPKTQTNGTPSADKPDEEKAAKEVGTLQELPNRGYREVELDAALSANVVKVEALRELVWNGIPPNAVGHRPTIWQILLGYLPANQMRREATLARKRREYAESVQQFFHMEEVNRTPQTGSRIAAPNPGGCAKNNPDVPFFQQDAIQRAMERILYIWAIRHPASGYVQGISEIICPFILVFLSAHVKNVSSVDVTHVDPQILSEVEADTYWCTTKLLDNIQDHYTAEQPGLQRMLVRFEDLIRRIDGPLYAHLLEQGVMVNQVAFKWMNCLLLRELPIRIIIRIWDTYFSQDGGFESFHIYFCTALLGHFSPTLLHMETMDLMAFFQDMPTKEWTEKEIEPLLSQAYIYSTLFEDSPNHLA
eukprot:CAMPEP_0117839336 /NCGR_PEP_ID=MMETSP0949-20121206/13928_1 /TAXON_ID=44440 /ORGANISM="Chattonella subsalsa, Strain CCMP2191" /LENGTH=461 /DNA_ID=CAMNT_0005682313 /DNA_START=182 /DNA_END=1568 /DNA_ORIENTATION=+